ncbi:hypothetical protein [Bradyrhizobium sp. USDA 10063]
MEDIKRDMAILATSGRDWAERTRRLAARVPDLDIFSQGLIARMNGGWRVTDKGRAVLEIMEARPAPAQATELPDVRSAEEPTPTRRYPAKTSDCVVTSVACRRVLSFGK